MQFEEKQADEGLMEEQKKQEKQDFHKTREVLFGSVSPLGDW